MKRTTIASLLALSLIIQAIGSLAASSEDRFDPQVKKPAGLDDSISLVFENASEIDEARLRIYFLTTPSDPHEEQSGASLMLEGTSFYGYPEGGTGWTWDRLNTATVQREDEQLIVTLTHPRFDQPFAYFLEVTGEDWSVEERWPRQGTQPIDPGTLERMQALDPKETVDMQALLDARPESLSGLFNQGPQLDGWNPSTDDGFEAADELLKQAAIGPAELSFTLHDAVSGETERAVPTRAWRKEDGYLWKGRTLGVDWAVIADSPTAGEVRITGWLSDPAVRSLRAEVGWNRSLEGFIWADDATHERRINSSTDVFSNAASSRYGEARKQSYYPFAVVGNQEQVFVLETDPSEPRVFLLAATADSLSANYEMALTPETKKFPGQATFRCSLYSLAPKGQSSFRLALENFYNRHPRYQERRVPSSGLWMPFSDISQLPEPQDFGFAFFEKGGPRGKDVDYAEESGILTLMYTEPWLYWLPFDPSESRTSDQTIEKMQHIAAAGSGWSRDLAASGLTGATRNANGELAIKFMDLPWNNGARMEVNTDPDLETVPPFRINRAQAEWQQIVEFLADPRVDGIYLDSMDAAVQPDSNPRALRATDYPATFTMDTLQPLIAPNVHQYEFTAALGTYLRSKGKFLMGNFPVKDAPFVNQWIDIPGQETDWFSGGHYHPPTRAQLNYVRAMSGQKPFGFLQSTDFSDFAGAPLRHYFETCLLYGFQPSFFSHNAADDPYWLDHDLLERDRHLFRTFVPLIRRIADAGWQAVQDFQSSPNPNVQIEQFGDSSEGIWHIVLQNLSENAETIDLKLIQQTGDVLLIHPLNGQVDWLAESAETRYTLEGNQILLIDVVSPDLVSEELDFLSHWQSGDGEAEKVLRSFNSILKERTLGIRLETRLANRPISGEPALWDLSLTNESEQALSWSIDEQTHRIQPGETKPLQIELPTSERSQDLNWIITTADGTSHQFNRFVKTATVSPVKVIDFEERYLTREDEATVPLKLHNPSDQTRTYTARWGTNPESSQSTSIELGPNANGALSLPVASADENTKSLQITLTSEDRVVWEATCRVVFLGANASLAIESGVTATTDSTFGGYSTTALRDGISDTEGLAWNPASWASQENEAEHWIEFQFPKPTAVKAIEIHWNQEAGILYTGQSGSVIATTLSGETKTLTNWKSTTGATSTRITFPPETVQSIRVTQDPLRGAKERPGIMWVSEVAVH